MGNCLVLENRVVKIVRNDGKILEYREPVKAHQILSRFSGHRLFDTLTTTQQHLNPEATLLCGRVYRLSPAPSENPNPNPKKKKVRFATPEVEAERSREDGDDERNVKVVRVRIVLSKQELQKLLEGGSVHEMAYQTLDKQDLVISHDLVCNKHALDSIPELE
ncbi:PREDICTED: uncharacterized protein LOC104826943 [Tarenaya hassleriana]|uniref:uncharacterized protein LOC104826943 n=1 Tax=Tarenaya hassleriana TaxID=28532 RepID=UPI00053C0FA8|nr:PREDICTED: uncharacterized protein LOC104826943 [Tarenaya hassleriana]